MLDDFEIKFLVEQVCVKYHIRSIKSMKNVADTLRMFSGIKFFGQVESDVEFMLFDQSIRFLLSIEENRTQITEHNIIPYFVGSIVITNKFYADYKNDISISNKKLAEILDVDVKYINEYELKCLCFTQSPKCPKMDLLCMSLSLSQSQHKTNNIFESFTNANSDSESTTTTKTFDSDQTIPMHSKRAKMYIEQLKMAKSSPKLKKSRVKKKKRSPSKKPFSLFI